jgi:hypothetical protein
MLAAVESLPTPIDARARLELGRLRDALVVMVNPEDRVTACSFGRRWPALVLVRRLRDVPNCPGHVAR